MLNQFKPANTPNRYWHAGLVLLCLTCLLLVAVARVASSEYDFKQTAARASGVVISQYAGKHHVKIRFTAANGVVVDYSQNGDISYEVGDHVTVLYDPADPARSAETEAIGAVWGWTLYLSIFTGTVFLFSMLTIFFPKYVHINVPFFNNDIEEK